MKTKRLRYLTIPYFVLKFLEALIQIDQSAMIMVSSLLPTEARQNSMDKFVQWITVLIQKKWPTAQISPFGSYASGLLSLTSGKTANSSKRHFVYVVHETFVIPSEPCIYSEEILSTQSEVRTLSYHRKRLCSPHFRYRYFNRIPTTGRTRRYR